MDIWTLALTLYKIPGECQFFKTFVLNKDDTLAEIVSTLGKLP